MEIKATNNEYIIRIPKKEAASAARKGLVLLSAYFFIAGYKWAWEYVEKGDGLTGIIIGTLTTAAGLITASPAIAALYDKYKPNQKV